MNKDYLTFLLDEKYRYLPKSKRKGKLAQELGISTDRVRKFFTGKQKLNEECLKKLIDVLGIDLNKLFPPEMTTKM